MNRGLSLPEPKSRSLVRLLPILLLVLVACSHSGGPAPVPPELGQVWVQQHFHNGSGGRPAASQPPDTRQLLEDAGVPVHEVTVKYLPMCQGPGCPTYSQVHFARIPEAMTASVAELGYRASRGPTQ